MIRKLLALYLSAWIALSTPASALADACMDAAAAGQAFGNEVRSHPANIPTLKPGDSIGFNLGASSIDVDVTEVFPGYGSQEAQSLQDTFGSDGAIQGKASEDLAELETGASEYAKAYQSFQHSINSYSHPSFANDPTVSKSDEFLTTLFTDEAFGSDFSECEKITEIIPGTTSSHVPEYRECYRPLTFKQHYELTRDFESESRNTQFKIAFYGVCSNTFEIDLVSGSWSIIPPLDGHSPDAIIPTIEYDDICPAGVDTNIYPVDDFWATHTDWNRGLYSYDSSYSVSWIQHPLCSNNLVAKVKLKDDGCSNDYDYGAEVTAGWTIIKKDEWITSGEIGDVINAINDGYAEAVVACTDEITNLQGVPISALADPPLAGLPKTCRKISIDITNTFNTGQMGCWTDTSGVLHCPENTGEEGADCEELEDDPNCAFLSSECVDGAMSDTGQCYAFEDRYDCGVDVEIPTTSRVDSYICPGDIRCMGTECVSHETEISNDFATAAAYLNAAQSMAMDMSCGGADQGGPHTDPDDEDFCKIFPGKKYECKKAMGGKVDCCISPGTVNFIEYISMLTYINKAASAENWLGGMMDNPVYGSWNAISEGLNSIIDDLTAPFVEAWEGLMGGSSSFVGDAYTAATSMFQGFMNNIANFVSETFGETAMNAMFTIGPDGAASLGGTVLGPLMTAYMIYQFINLLIQIIWQCEECEFELGVKKDLKVCHYIGSYCATDIVGVCIETRKSYCCYNSPLSRILQEQIRKVLGKSWGDAKNPDCGALTIEDLQNTDWGQVDLSEWLGILQMTGNLPAFDPSRLNLDGLTGTGSTLNVDGIGRDNSVERTMEAIGDSNLSQVREDARQELWGN